LGSALYDRIGRGYTATRRPDPRIAALIQDSLGDARSVLNVGAGAGAYEPAGRSLIAVEPSRHMIQQRATGAPPAVQAFAEALPFTAQAFDAALAVLTLHHWHDWRLGLREMRRVADKVVVFTFDTSDARRFWLTEAYFPEIAALDQRRCPPVAEIADELGSCRVETVAVPCDCVDGFLAAYWRRPEAYLDPAVRAGMSGFAALGGDVIAPGVARLDADLKSGVWDSRFGHLRSIDALDAGYRLLVAS
jgi:SAM-dependent methyltransferase